MQIVVQWPRCRQINTFYFYSCCQVLRSASDGLIKLLFFFVPLSIVRFEENIHAFIMYFSLIVNFPPTFFICQIIFIHSLLSHQSNTFWTHLPEGFPPSTIIEHEGGAHRKVNIKSQPKNTVGNLRSFRRNDCHIQRKTTQQSPAEMLVSTGISTGDLF